MNKKNLLKMKKQNYPYHPNSNYKILKFYTTKIKKIKQILIINKKVSKQKFKKLKPIL